MTGIRSVFVLIITSGGKSEGAVFHLFLNPLQQKYTIQRPSQRKHQGETYNIRYETR